MRSGGFVLIRRCLYAGGLTLAALMLSACGSSAPPGAGAGGCAPGTASGMLCPARGVACGYQAPNGYTTCTCNKDGKWHCDTAKCPGNPPHTGSNCSAGQQGMVCNYPSEGCQCVVVPGGYQWSCH